MDSKEKKLIDGLLAGKDRIIENLREPKQGRLL
jgi:hypothetical protein